MTTKKTGNGHAYPGDPLSPRELEHLRLILDEDAKTRWLWTKLRFWAVAIGGAAALLVAFRENLGEIFRWFVK